MYLIVFHCYYGIVPGRSLASAGAGLSGGRLPTRRFVTSIASRPNRTSRDGDGQRPLQQSDGYDQLLGAVDFGEDARDVAKRSLFDRHCLPGLQKRPGSRQESRSDDGLDSRDLVRIHWNGHLSQSDNANDTRYQEDRQTTGYVQPAENVARKERKIHVLKAIRPPLPAAEQWQELAVAAQSQT
jgi:hypothetical protein